MVSDGVHVLITRHIVVGSTVKYIGRKRIAD